MINYGADTGAGSGGEESLLLQLEQRREEMEALVGRRAQFDDSAFTNADEPEIVTGRIESVRLQRGGRIKKTVVEPHWRVSIQTSDGRSFEVAYDPYITVLPEDLEVQ